jgi:hypothetical protein
LAPGRYLLRATIRPGDAAGAPTTSSLNVETGSNIPNAVQVALPVAGGNAGQIDITYDAYGQAGRTTELLIDIVGYTTNTGLQELVSTKTVLPYNGSNTEATPVFTYELIRTVGNFTKRFGSTAIRLDWSAHHSYTGANGVDFCHYQLRIDGKATDGDSATGFQGDQEGNAVAFTSASPIATFGEFAGLTAGAHTVQIFVRGDATTCTLNNGNFNQQVVVEEYSPSTASAFDQPLPASDGSPAGGE